MFHLADTQVLLSSGGCYGLPEGATVQTLLDMTDDSEDTRARKKRDKKQVSCKMLKYYSSLNSLSDSV